VVAGAAVTLQLVDWHSPVRAIAVASFVLIAPGWAVLDIWRLTSGWAGVSMILAVNLALATLIPGALLYAHAWSPTAALLVLAAVTVLGATIATVRRRRRA